MAFLPKEELYAKAKELGISIEDHSFPQLQGLVAKALAGTAEMTSPNKGNTYQLDPMTNKKVVGKAHYVGRPKVLPKKSRFSPEMFLNQFQLHGFEEVVGDQPTGLTDPFTEMRMNIGKNTSDQETEKLGGQRPTGKTGKKVVATTGMPHGNAEIYYERDAPAGLFSAKFGPKDGYVWSNQSPIVIFDPDDKTKSIQIHVRGVKDVLEELDRLADYQEKCENYQDYAFNIKIINKAYVRSMLREIAKEILKEKKLNG